jgi:hypothetical protein
MGGRVLSLKLGLDKINAIKVIPKAFGDNFFITDMCYIFNGPGLIF